MTQAIEVRQLCRWFGRPRRLGGGTGPPRVALDCIDLTVQAGEIHGLLGPNGAGKTTLCRILSTVLLPSAGSARVCGYDVVAMAPAVRRSIGLVFGGERGLYTRLTARQNLMYWSALYRQPTRDGRRRVAELLERVGLAERADDRVETFSRGMKQRLHLARGLVGNPRVLILDEPTVGLDPVAARDLRLLLTEASSDGRTVLLTTHDMVEAEQICDQVSLIDGGRLLATRDPRTIGEWLSAYERVTASEVPEELVGVLPLLPGVRVVRHGGPERQLVVEVSDAGDVRQVLRLLLDAGVTAIATGRPSLEDAYFHLIGDRGLVVR